MMKVGLSAAISPPCGPSARKVAQRRARAVLAVRLAAHEPHGARRREARRNAPLFAVQQTVALVRSAAPPCAAVAPCAGVAPRAPAVRPSAAVRRREARRPYAALQHAE